jgi:1-acyl-sn-glycerol-3-phosphate acyltransferase
MKIFGCGHDYNKGPLKAGCMKSFLYKWVRLSDFLLLANCGFFTWRKKLDVDYTKYLGPNYKDSKRPVKKVSTIISNHVSWLDSHFIFLYYNVAFTLDKAFETMPIMNDTAKCLDSIFV